MTDRTKVAEIIAKFSNLLNYYGFKHWAHKFINPQNCPKLSAAENIILFFQCKIFLEWHTILLIQEKLASAAKGFFLPSLRYSRFIPVCSWSFSTSFACSSSGELGVISLEVDEFAVGSSCRGNEIGSAKLILHPALSPCLWPTILPDLLLPNFIPNLLKIRTAEHVSHHSPIN